MTELKKSIKERCNKISNDHNSVFKHNDHNATLFKVKQSLYRPRGFQEVEVPRFQENRLMKVATLSSPSTGHLYPQEMLLVLISVRG